MCAIQIVWYVACSAPMLLACHFLFLSPHSKGKVRKAPTGGAGEFKKQTVKYTAQKLHEKGVILEIEGLPNHQ